MSVEHYENFPVASWLCPAALRPPILAIYGFARVADDLADEGQASATQRQADLAAYRTVLHRLAAGEPAAAAVQAAAAGRWLHVFGPLAEQMRLWRLPVQLLDDLIDAFLQDTGNPDYPDRNALLDYCRRSANPIGRLLLHLYGLDSPQALSQSDDICTALQLINFWQDPSVDLPRGRCYFPQEDADRFGLTLPSLRERSANPQAERALLLELLGWAATLMARGAPLVHQMPGRVGWELRLVVQGGLRIAEKIRHLNASGQSTFEQRPLIALWDGPLILLRAMRMHPSRIQP